MNLCFNAFKNYFKVSNAWTVQPQAAQKKLHAPLTYPNFAKENDYYFCEHFVTLLFHNIYVKCRNSKASRTQSMFVSSNTYMGLVSVAVIQKEQ